MARSNTSKHTAFVCIYMKQTMASSCFRGLKGHSDPSCTRSSGTMTILWIPPTLHRLPPEGASLSSTRPSYRWELRGAIHVSYGYMLLYVSICMSMCPGLSVALPVWVPEITHWQINGLSWPSSLLQAALCGRAAHSSNTACLWGSPAINQTQGIVLTSTYIHWHRC